MEGRVRGEHKSHKYHNAAPPLAQSLERRSGQT